MLLQDPTAAAGSPTLRAAFIGVTVLTASLFIGGVYWSSLRTGQARDVAIRRMAWAAITCVAWIALTGVLAARGVLSFGVPPTMPILLVVMVVLAVLIVRSTLGKQLATGLPVAALVASQGFRLPLELSMHQAYNEGLMPVQMSYSGRNFDIITGITALLVGLWLATGERRNWRGVVLGWNVLGVLLLLNILLIALLSAPVPFRRFMNEPANTWVLQAPWVWLPTVMVFAALLGHLLVFRRLRAGDSR
jgi:hypothetical protein